MTVPQERTIIIDSDQSLECIADTLTHEVLHACLSANYVHGLDTDQEERVVRALEIMLSSVLKNNKPWWKMVKK